MLREKGNQSIALVRKFFLEALQKMFAHAQKARGVYHFSPLYKLPPLAFGGYASTGVKKGPPLVSGFRVVGLDFFPRSLQVFILRVSRHLNPGVSLELAL